MDFITLMFGLGRSYPLSMFLLVIFIATVTFGFVVLLDLSTKESDFNFKYFMTDNWLVYATTTPIGILVFGALATFIHFYEDFKILKTEHNITATEFVNYHLQIKVEETNRKKTTKKEQRLKN